MNKYICIHGHFYQPPRENPWLEAVEMQDSAYPYHDWNERITAECYAPNSASRILNDHQEIASIVNNYQNISFNFGPTLITWFRDRHPHLLQKIIDADQQSQNQFQGHGAAIAQAYNHMILPLANTRDRYTQIYWGIRHFELYFKRRPEGLWLPETAVDLATLDIMAEAGIKFTILAPNQAQRVRKIDSPHWHDVSDSQIDIHMAYLQKLPSGRSIALFFYDGPTSRAVAFEKLLANGSIFANRLIDLCQSSHTHPQLMHIATDGETYGHHHPFGDMALGYALQFIKEQNIAEITIYGQFLAQYPPTHEVEIFDNSSWSCAHGIERWKADCGCNSGQNEGWRQTWRAPLRASLDWLRDTLIPLYEEHTSKYLRDPWQARNDYIEVIHDRSLETLANFLDKHVIADLNDTEIQQLLKALEMQRHALLMYTSCGWFFDEVSGIETVQILQYAARAIQLAQALANQDYESTFLDYLAQVPSNIPEYGNAKKIYELFVITTRFELPAVTAHYAISSLFKDYAENSDIYCYGVHQIFSHTLEAGKITLKTGSVFVTSKITLETIHTDYALIHYGDQNLRCGVRIFQDESAYKAMEKALTDTFSRGDFLEIPKILEQYFNEPLYTLGNLFRDEQRKVIGDVLKSPLLEADNMYRFFYDNHASIMNYVNNLAIPLPRPLHKTIEYVINANLKQALEDNILDIDKIQQVYEEAKQFHTEFYQAEIGYLFQKKLENVFRTFQDNPFNEEFLGKLIHLLEVINTLNLGINLWRVQNMVYQLSLANNIKDHANENYKNLFQQLLQQLNMNIL